MFLAEDSSPKFADIERLIARAIWVSELPAVDVSAVLCLSSDTLQNSFREIMLAVDRPHAAAD